nr:histidine ammonia-lyase [Raoultella sp. NCTC 9187]
MLDNFVTSGLQEDHLSLGTGSALKLQRLLSNLYQILAIEYLLAAQALEFHPIDMLARGTRHGLALLRQSVATWEDDRWLAPEIAKAVATIKKQPANWLA